MAYLSERVAELPAKSIDLEFVSRSSLLTMEKKDGGEYQCYKYVFKVPATGEIIEEKIFPPKGTESKKDDAAKWLRIDISKIVFGYMNTLMAQGMTIQESVIRAEGAFREQEKLVEKLFSEKTKPDLGIDEMHFPSDR